MDRYHVLGFFAGLLIIFFGFTTFTAFGETIIRTIKPQSRNLAQPYIEEDFIKEPNPLNYLSINSASLVLGLKLGSTGESVRTLQLLLNSTSSTMIAKGIVPGAPGQETTYFGSKTETALKKFQVKYGLNQSGYVDQPTFVQLNTVFNQYLKLSTENQDTAKQMGSLPTTDPVNQITAENQAIYDSIFKRADLYESQLPDNRRATADMYTFNGTGPDPIITSASPEIIYSGDYIVITGENFSKENNKIISGFDVFKGIPSYDGKTIRFKFDSEYQRRVDLEIKNAGGKKEQEKARNAFRSRQTGANEFLPVSITVLTENGMSNTVQIKMKLQ